VPGGVVGAHPALKGFEPLKGKVKDAVFSEHYHRGELFKGFRDFTTGENHPGGFLVSVQRVGGGSPEAQSNNMDVWGREKAARKGGVNQLTKLSNMGRAPSKVKVLSKLELESLVSKRLM